MHPPEEYTNNNYRESEQTGLVHNSKTLGEINNLDKVRDILFGSQIREVEKKFTRLEERLSKEFANVRDETRKRLDALEIYIKKEVESLTERLKNEQSERDSGVKSLAEEQKNISLALEKKFAQFEEQTTSYHRELREQILSQSNSLQDDIHQKYAEILALLEREAQELRRDKTDRSSLASLFTELAIRINSETNS